MNKHQKTKKPNYQSVKALSHPHYDRSVAWIAIVVVGYLILTITLFAFASFTLASIMFLAAIVYFLVVNYAPRETHVSFGDKAVTINKIPLPYHQIRWFRIFQAQDGKFFLELQPLQKTKLPMGIHLSAEAAAHAVKVLSPKVPWNLKINELFADRLSRLLRI